MKLSPEDRAMIDAHLSAKGAIQCPPGVTTPSEEVGYRNKIYQRLPDAEVKRRNAAIDERHARGITARDIAREMKLSEQFVGNRIQWLRYKASLLG